MELQKSAEAIVAAEAVKGRTVGTEPDRSVRWTVQTQIIRLRGWDSPGEQAAAPPRVRMLRVKRARHGWEPPGTGR